MNGYFPHPLGKVRALSSPRETARRSPCWAGSAGSYSRRMSARVLVVDDDPTIAGVTGDYLRDAGLEPRHAAAWACRASHVTPVRCMMARDCRGRVRIRPPRLSVGHTRPPGSDLLHGPGPTRPATPDRCPGPSDPPTVLLATLPHKSPSAAPESCLCQALRERGSLHPDGPLDPLLSPNPPGWKPYILRGWVKSVQMGSTGEYGSAQEGRFAGLVRCRRLPAQGGCAIRIRMAGHDISYQRLSFFAALHRQGDELAEPPISDPAGGPEACYGGEQSYLSLTLFTCP